MLHFQPLSKRVHEKQRAPGENHYTKAESKCSEAAEDGTTLKSLKLNVESKVKFNITYFIC